MPATYDPIATTTLSTASTSVSFASIPATYTDLVLVCNLIPGSANDNLKLVFNSNTASIYSLQQTTSGGANEGIDTSGSGAGAIYNTDITTNHYHIFNYANTNTTKNFLYQFFNVNYNITSGIGLFNNSSAISTIDISISGGSNFQSKSMFTLYGIKAA